MSTSIYSHISPIKSFTNTHNRHFKLGRRRPVAPCPRLHLRNYMLKSLPDPPTSINYGGLASSSLAQIYDNDTLGDCVIACMGHVEGILTGNANGGNPLILSNSEVISLYSAISGYVPGNPSTDNGCDPQTALNYWQQNGLSNGNNKIAAWIAVNGNNLPEMRTALWLFENLIFGIDLPDAWINPAPEYSGFWWSPSGSPDPANGHCFPAYGYVPDSLQISTWGLIGNLTNGAAKKYTTEQGGELYTVLSQDAIIKALQRAPNGFDFSQLLADIDSMRM